MENNKQEELDLLFVLRRIKGEVLNILRAIKWLFDFSLKNIFKLSLFVIVCTGICIGMYLMKKKYYTSTISISHTRIENDYCYEMVTNLNSYIDYKENNRLAEKLSLSPAVAKEIIGIKYLPLNSNIAKRYADSTEVMLPFKIEVEVYDNNILDTLQVRLMNYLELNDYAKKMKDLNKVSLEKAEERTKKEMREIDSLKGIVNMAIIPRSTGTGITIGEPIDPVPVYRESMALYEKLLEVDKKQHLNDSFELMVGFTKTNKASGHGKLWYLALGLLIGYVIGIIFLTNRQFNRTK